MRNEVKLLVSDLRLRQIVGRVAMPANDLVGKFDREFDSPARKLVSSIFSTAANVNACHLLTRSLNFARVTEG